MSLRVELELVGREWEETRAPGWYVYDNLTGYGEGPYECRADAVDAMNGPNFKEGMSDGSDYGDDTEGSS